MKIFAVDTNYLQHNKMLSNSFSKPEAPAIFTKCDTALLKDGKPFFIPDTLGNIEYETELVVRICKLGKTIPTRFASRYYDAVTVGVDFTARDLQKRLQEQGLPWELSKGFDGAAALGTFVPLDKVKPIECLRFRLDINGTTVQEGFSGDMLFKVDEIISYISQYFTLRTGDLLYTGCPTGCAPVRINDHLEGYIEEQKVLEFNCK
jgi:FAH family protein